MKKNNGKGTGDGQEPVFDRQRLSAASQGRLGAGKALSRFLAISVSLAVLLAAAAFYGRRYLPSARQMQTLDEA